VLLDFVVCVTVLLCVVFECCVVLGRVVLGHVGFVLVLCICVCGFCIPVNDTS
jgi:hypothetical protein